jgi:hypothetical protein
MTIEIAEHVEGNVLEVRISGKLTADDYGKLAPEIGRLIAAHGKVRILLEMTDFHGWTAGALWEDVKFDLKHFSDIERLAMVGEKAWQKGMSVFCKPFTSAEIRYYEQANLDRARAWLAGQ